MAYTRFMNKIQSVINEHDDDDGDDDDVAD